MRRRRFLIAIAVALLLAAVWQPALADMSQAISWLRAQQREDGGFGGQKSTLSETAEAIYAFVAAGVDPKELQKGYRTPLTFLAESLPEAMDVGTKAKVALAVAVAGGDPRHFGGVDLIAAIRESLSAEGAYGGPDGTLIGHTYAMLALEASLESVAPQAVSWLKERQASNGGWAWNGSQKPEDVDSNTTSLAVQALIGAGVSATDPTVKAALSYLRSIQNEDGGFPYQKPSPYGSDTDANSTALAIQAIIAAGESPSKWTTAEGKDPVAALMALQNKSGAFAWQASFADDNFLATAQAIPALAGKPHPLRPLASQMAQPAATPAPAPILPVSGGGVAAQPALWTLVLTGASGMAAVALRARRRA
jgi:hypothetical protein